MSLKTHIARAVARTLTSPARERLRRRLHRLRRRDGVAEVHYFHQADDPYSQLAASALAPLAQRYAIRLVPHLVGPPADAAAPDRERLARWSLRDARTLAAAVGDATRFTDEAPSPSFSTHRCFPAIRGLGRL